jgi:hypothetical protein
MEVKLENLTLVFDEIKSLMQAYTPPLIAKMDDSAHYDLWSVKDLVIEGRKRKEVYFAGLIIQKSYVGFYYMPIYAKPELKTVFAPELIKLLKGKSCFHVKKLDDTLKEQIRAALKIGYENYQKNGWV